MQLHRIYIWVIHKLVFINVNIFLWNKTLCYLLVYLKALNENKFQLTISLLLYNLFYYTKFAFKQQYFDEISKCNF